VKKVVRFSFDGCTLEPKLAVAGPDFGRWWCHVSDVLVVTKDVDREVGAA